MPGLGNSRWRLVKVGDDRSETVSEEYRLVESLGKHNILATVQILAGPAFYVRHIVEWDVEGLTVNALVVGGEERSLYFRYEEILDAFRNPSLYLGASLFRHMYSPVPMVSTGHEGER